MISKIRQQHIDTLKNRDKDHDDGDSDEVVRVAEELARVYHYYLHGRDSKLEPESSSSSESDEESESSPSSRRPSSDARDNS